MSIMLSLIAVIIIAVIPVLAVGVGGVGGAVFGVILPAVGFGVLFVGIVLRVLKWARAPVPFRIPTTCGQQKSLPWIHNDELDNPSNTWAVIGRMLLEVLFFRSLFRNTTARVDADNMKVSYAPSYWLWAASMLFHWTMLVVVLRHFRFFIEPTPVWITWLQNLDGFFQIGVPVIYVSTILFGAGLAFLLARRLFDAKLRYLSLPADYFALFLLLGIGISGALMRHIDKVNIMAVKEAMASLTSFQLVAPTGVGMWFYVHITLVSVLFAYFPFSKLLHAPGVFLSPTRNLANSNREKRHINPWNPEVQVHTYVEWEDHFRDKLIASGYTLDKE